MKHKAAMLLEFFLSGGRMQINGHVWLMDDQQRLGTLAYKYVMESENHYKVAGPEIVLNAMLSLSEFIDLVEDIPEENLFIANAEQVITEINKK